MPNTTRMAWPFPNENQDPWYDALSLFASAQDASGYAAREDRHLVLADGGVISWDAGTSTLDWDSDILIASPITGFSLRVEAAAVSIDAGQALYATLIRAPTQNSVLAVTVSSQVPSTDTAYLLAIRIGTQIYWRNGLLMDDGDTVTGLGTKQTVSGNDPNAIHDNVAGEIAAVAAKASSSPRRCRWG